MIRVLYFPWRRARWRHLLAGSRRIELHEVALDPRRDFGPRLALAGLEAVRLARRHRPHVVLAESLGLDGFLAAKIARAVGARFAVRLKNDLWQELEEPRPPTPMLRRWARRISDRLVRATIGAADLVLAIAEPTAAVARARLGPERRIRVVPNDIRRPDGDWTPTRVPTSILTVSNFGFRAKNEPLLALLPQLRGYLERHQRTWTILGAGRWLEIERARIGASAAWQLAGFQPVEPYYAARPIAGLISGFDALPNAYLDAAARQLPLLVNHGGPIAGFVEHERSALVVDLGDLAAVEAALDRLTGDLELVRRIGRAGREQALARFAPEIVQAQIEQALDELVSD